MSNFGIGEKLKGFYRGTTTGVAFVFLLLFSMRVIHNLNFTLQALVLEAEATMSLFI